jgi:SAM-dependent methyltransferase
MNRKQRRANVKHAGRSPSPATSSRLQPPAALEDFCAAAMADYRKGDLASAERLCRAALERNPRHVPSLVLLGDLVQQGGRNKLAVKLLGQALALDPYDVAAHDNIAMAYQALGRRDEAVRHFTQAVALGLRDPEMLIRHSAAIGASMQRHAAAWPKQLQLSELLEAQGASPVTGEALLVALLQSKPISDFGLESWLTAIRRELLRHVAENGHGIVEAKTLALFCALAQQCFINEYVFALDDTERAQLEKVRGRVRDALAAAADIAPLDLVALASYLPLHRLPEASSLLSRRWPDDIGRLLTQQIREPLEEASDYDTIPKLTSIDDGTSLQVQNQYEENPYPRWTTLQRVKPATVTDFLQEKLGVRPASWSKAPGETDILVAGCGTGLHSIETAQRFPQSRLLAIDISRAGLAYARRKTLALGLTNIEYAQADILKFASRDVSFDVIEVAGVLHHLSDPEEAWRLLLSLLRPNGLMLVGLYSAPARRFVTAARAFIAERGYRATADDIRTCRQELIKRGSVPPSKDFSSTSGCRDLLFNVMEHQFTIPRIAAFLEANRLTFLGFEQLSSDVHEQFRKEFPDAAAARDLARWHEFELKHPHTFIGMYLFWVQTQPK